MFYLIWPSVDYRRSLIMQFDHEDAWKREDCLSLLADSDHCKTISLAEHHGFQLPDVRMSLEQNPVSTAWHSDDSGNIRMAREDDLPALKEIAGRTHRDTRFYFDE